MEIRVLLVTGIFFLVAGVYQMAKEAFHVARSRDQRRIRRAFSHKKESDVFLSAARELGRFLLMADSQKRRLAQRLKTAGIDLAPETYVTRAILKALVPLAGFLFLAMLPSHILVAFLMILFGILTVLIFFKEFDAVSDTVRQKKEEIEWELPRMVDSILQEFRHHRDLVRILENYKESAGGQLKRELEITIADMKTGNIENALIRFDGRLGIPGLSSVVRGLLAVVQGEDGIFYFQMLQHDLKAIEFQKLKRMALTRPGKMRRYTSLIVVLFIVLCFLMLILQAYYSVLQLNSY